MAYLLQPTVPGLTFNSATGLLSGTPTTNDIYPVTYTVQDADANTVASDAGLMTFIISPCRSPSRSLHAIRGMPGRRGDLVWIENSQRTSAGWIRLRRLRDGLPLAGNDIIAPLPVTMEADGQVYTPYSCIAFDVTASGTAATDIEHIVALAEAHDCGIADDRRRDIASGLDSLMTAVRR